MENNKIHGMPITTEIDKRVNLNKPYKCPVCEGNGLVQTGFYYSRYMLDTIVPTTSECCRTCGGTGIVWG